ncbi:MAG: multicopper oxidase type 2, partial [bacterium]|nr:multicopper oxidase type 2 [bacterium]
TLAADGIQRPAQPLPSLIVIDSAKGQKRALLRISDLSTTEFTTLGTVGIPMTVIAQNARLLRDMGGNNLYYNTNSITLGGGESADVILDATGIPKGTYYLYATNLDHLSNDAENFGGMMTEIVVR